MLDVHPPPQATHTWRDFFIHIATIVIGLLIAVGLEQTVEYIHHLHQLHQVQEALREEGLENREVIQHDELSAARSAAGADTDIAALQAAANAKAPTVSLNPAPLDLFAPGDNAWLTLRDSGLLAIAPRPLVENYWKVYYEQQRVVEDIKAIAQSRNSLDALLSLHGSTADLTPAERDGLLASYATYRQSLKVLSRMLANLDLATSTALAGRKIDLQTKWHTK